MAPTLAYHHVSLDAVGHKRAQHADLDRAEAAAAGKDKGGLGLTRSR
jgi:hypothetical protein